MCEHFCHPVCSTACEQVLLVVKVTLREIASEEGFLRLRLQMSGECHLKRLTTIGALKKHRNKQVGLRSGPAPIPSSSLRFGSDRLAYGIATRQLARRVLVSCRRYRKTSLSEARASFARTGRPVAGTARCCATLVVAPEFEEHLRDRDIHGFEELVISGLSQLGHASIRYSSLLCVRRTGLRRYVLLSRSCGADQEDCQSVFRTLWRVHRSWSLAIPAEF